MKKNFLWKIFGVLLASLLVLSTCDIQADMVADIINAAEPTITTQPAAVSGGVVGNISPLSVVASVSDKGTLSYQWYAVNGSSETAASGTTGATSATFQPVITEEGVYYYYVAVTNTNNEAKSIKQRTVKSVVAIIAAYEQDKAQYPVIAPIPSQVESWTGSAIAITLTASATVYDGGTLSYQWYECSYDEEGVPIYNTAEGIPIEGAISATYNTSVTDQKSYLYFVVVTNTRDSAGGRQTAETVSDFVSVFVGNINATITVNTSQLYQYIRGFGGMDVGWDTFPAYTAEDIDNMFNPDKLGYNMLRIMIMPYSTDIDEMMEAHVNNETIDRSYYYDFVKTVNRYGGYVLASPWSPPADWKSNGNTIGGGAGENAKLLPEFYPAYADYLKAFCQHMLDHDAPIYAISIQNEPNFRANYDGCEWEPFEMRDFFKEVGHFTDGVRGYGGGQWIDTVLTVNGESANHPNINDSALDDPESRQHIDLIARHIYGDRQVRYANAIDHPTDPKEVWMTEHNVNGGTEASYLLDSTWNYIWQFMNDVDMSIRLNDESAFVWWSLKRFYCFIGEGRYGTSDGQVMPRAHGMSHYAKFATDMYRTGVNVSGTLKNASGTQVNITFNGQTSNVNNSREALTSQAVKVTAFVSADGKKISMVLFTPSGNAGTTGYDLGNVLVQLPAGFRIGTAEAMRSTANIRSQSEMVSVNPDRNSAIVNMPRGHILSLRFTKE